MIVILSPVEPVVDSLSRSIPAAVAGPLRAKCLLRCFSHVHLFMALWTVPRQAPRPWNFPGRNTGVGCHFLLEGIFLTQGSNLHLLCLLYCRQIQNTTCFTCFLAFVYILLLEYKFIFGTFACFVHHHAGVLKYLLKGRIA